MDWILGAAEKQKSFASFLQKRRLFLNVTGSAIHSSAGALGNRLVDFLRDWQDAPALVLSCPGPMRRHAAALIPLSKLALPQVFLGGESQCMAFAAAQPGLAGRLFFAPAPEMFADPISLQAAWRAAGEKPQSPGDVVHLRFGSVRDCRVLKGVRNAAVIAEATLPAPITTSHHPFASGHVLPHAMRRLYVYGKQALRPAATGGVALPCTELHESCVTADLATVSARARASGGLDLVRLAEYEDGAWASGQAGKPAAVPGETQQIVLLPWNMAHFGSVVPELLRRIASFHRPGTGFPAVLLMPFNDPGFTGRIQDLRKTIGAAAEEPDHVLRSIFLARVTHLRGLARLKALSPTVWVDGNDPEAWWSLARFATAGFDAACLPADERIRVDAHTPFGLLHYDAGIPAQRALRDLLARLHFRQGTGRPG
jgi:hypothetical protein